ncbi:MAG TPA: DUF72 domain-containing protein [Acidimicrobiales bacterium]|nr:DUF72 domain-containing protein [Acidimicrobiales bacterium]
MAEGRVGTSGWSYPEWIGRFYPAGTSTPRMLPFYARRFRTVELHSTYRNLPSPAAIERWKSSVAADFRFAPKAHLGITHRRDLTGIEDRVTAFLTAVAPLAPNLGPVLIALPHQAVDLERLDRLLAALPRPTEGSGFHFAFQLHAGWLVPGVLDRLEAHGSTLVIVEAEGPPPRPLQVGSFTYVRLRRDRYTRAELHAWGARMADDVAAGRDAYLFLKHDEVADGPRYARQVSTKLGAPVPEQSELDPTDA